jgi:hypothetical protein
VINMAQMGQPEALRSLPIAGKPLQSLSVQLRSAPIADPATMRRHADPIAAAAPVVSKAVPVFASAP